MENLGDYDASSVYIGILDVQKKIKKHLSIDNLAIIETLNFSSQLLLMTILNLADGGKKLELQLD